MSNKWRRTSETLLDSESWEKKAEHVILRVDENFTAFVNTARFNSWFHNLNEFFGTLDWLLSVLLIIFSTILGFDSVVFNLFSFKVASHLLDFFVGFFFWDLFFSFSLDLVPLFDSSLLFGFGCFRVLNLDFELLSHRWGSWALSSGAILLMTSFFREDLEISSSFAIIKFWAVKREGSANVKFQFWILI